MLVETRIDDYEILEGLDTLYYSVEIGELYERDKFKWTERQNLDQEKRKQIEFNFKMNHIKQTVRANVTYQSIDKSRDNRLLYELKGAKRGCTEDDM